MLAAETPQESVNAARPRPATCDIVIVILWSRMGTPLPDTPRKPNDEPYLSGTEWEYEDAVNSPEQPPPQVLVYRRTEEPKIGLRDPQKKEKEEQFERIEAFFEQLRSLKRGVNEYATPSDFKVLLASTWRTSCIGTFSRLPRPLVATLDRRRRGYRPTTWNGYRAGAPTSACWARASRRAEP